MSCCGKYRQQFRPPVSATGRSGERPTGQLERREQPASAVYVRYDGGSAMTVVGGSTGTRYRFGRPGAILAVDRRDLSSLNRVPRLTLVNRPPTVM